MNKSLHYSLLLTIFTSAIASAIPFETTPNTLPETSNLTPWLAGDRKITSLDSAQINSGSHIDLITLSHSGDEVNWLELSSPTPSIQNISTTIYGPEAVLAMEATGDTHTDIIVSSRWDRTLSLCTNDGNGNFTKSTIASNLDCAVSLTKADLDGNGHLDIIGISDHSKELFWISQTSAGSFATAQVLHTLSATPSHVIAANIDSDNSPEILILADGKISILKNNGSGSFSQTSQVGNGSITSFCVANIDGGFPDIVSSSTLGISWLYANDNSGAFTSQTLISSSLTGYDLVGIVDLDSDNHLDLLYTSHLSSSMIWYKGDSSGSFLQQNTTSLSNGSAHSTLADFDGDQDIDLALSAFYSPDLSLYQGLASNRPYDFWAQANGVDPSVNPPGSDTNNDGTTNTTHYATNTSPTDNNITSLIPGTGTSGLPVLHTLPSGEIIFEFLRRTDNSPHGLTFTLKQSDALLGWNDITLNGTNSTVSPIDDNWERVRYMVPDSQNKLFYRLNYTYTEL